MGKQLNDQHASVAKPISDLEKPRMKKRSEPELISPEGEFLHSKSEHEVVFDNLSFSWSKQVSFALRLWSTDWTLHDNVRVCDCREKLNM